MRIALFIGSLSLCATLLVGLDTHLQKARPIPVFPECASAERNRGNRFIQPPESPYPAFPSCLSHPQAHLEKDSRLLSRIVDKSLLVKKRVKKERESRGMQ